MPRPARASRKPPTGEEAEKASKKIAATTGKKERKAVEKEVVEKPVAPPARATRSRGAVEVVIETSQASQATAASTRTSPEKPTATRRRGQSQQPVVPVAEVTTLSVAAVATALPKRSTRSATNSTTTSITIEEVIRKTPSPKKPTRAAARVPLHKKQKSDSRAPAAPPTPEITPLSPEIQVPASSDAENRSPAGSAHFASSPPAIMGTAPLDDDDEAGPTTPTQTKGKRERIHLEFAEDEGYTPPRARPSSAERPRLRELGVESLEPLDRLPGIDEDDVASSGGFAGDDEDGPASPTPKRANKWKLSQLAEEEEEAGEEADLEDNDGIPESVRPGHQHRKKRFGSPFQFQKGKKKGTLPPTAAVATIEVEDMTFAIYSDPNTPSPTLPDIADARELDEIMRPPISSSPVQESPQHSRKRRSSSGGVGSDDEEVDEVEEHHNQTRGGKRRKQASRSKLAAVTKPKVLQTEELRGLLPKRKGRGKHAERDEFDLSPSPSEEGEDEEDELSRPTKRKPKPTKKSKSKTKPKSTTTTAAKITQSAWSRPLVPTTMATTTTTIKKKYARKSTGSEKENEAPSGNKNRNGGGPGEEDEAATTTSGTVVEVADGILGKEGRKKLRDAAEKFRIVDSWEMDFEDVSGSTSV